MWRTWVEGAWVLLAAMGCGGPTPERADAAALIDLPEVSVYWQLDGFAVPDVPPRPDVGRADRPVVNPCDGGLTRCLGTSTCVDLRVDRANCGACNASCDDRSECLGGSCVGLPGDEAICGGERVHLTTDTRHCGGCGRSCGDTGGCIAANCEAACRAESQRCPGMISCVDVQSNEAHCGSCGNACQTGETCHEGTCVGPCPGTGVRCAGSGACLDLQTDPMNCGACARRCSSGEECAAASCTPRCRAGEIRCASGSCADIQSDIHNCGGCGVTCLGVRATSTLCRDGGCVVTCEPGFAQCAGPASACQSVMGTDTANCGACGRSCEAGESCLTGECVAPGARLVSPLSGTLNASRRPRFRWAPPPDGGAVVVEVCASRGCRTVEDSQTVTTGDAIRWPTALSPGPHWWRVRRPGGGRVAAVTWEIFVPEADSPVPLIGAPQADYNGDGVLDTISVARPPGCPADRDCFQVLYGSTPGTTPTEASTIELRPRTQNEVPGYGTWYTNCHLDRAVVIGDINGDGYVDLWVQEVCGTTRVVVTGYPYPTAWSTYASVYHGSPVGFSSRLYIWTSVVSRLMDFNGDGYADFLMVPVSYLDDGSRDPVHRLWQLYVGGSPTVPAPPPFRFAVTSLVHDDFNGDGIEEIVGSSEWSRPMMQLPVAGSTTISSRPLPTCGTVNGEGPEYRWTLGDRGDRNGDGYPDLVATLTQGSTRQTLTWLGGPDGLTASRCSVTSSAP